MNFTSQICTTKEQSERLLALGLKRETADMGLAGDIPIAIEDWKTQDTTLIDSPAWSLHRLIKIYSKNSITPMVKLDEIDFDWLVDNIAFRIKEHDIYKDYLEK